MNRVHPYRKADRYEALHHFVLAFHDSTFECAAKSFEVTTGRGSLLKAATGALAALIKR